MDSVVSDVRMSVEVMKVDQQFLDLGNRVQALGKMFRDLFVIIRSDRISRHPRNPLFVCMYVDSFSRFNTHLLISFNSGKLRCIQVSLGKLR